MTSVLNPGRPFTGGEREQLENTLELHRDELVRAVGQLSDAQARRKLVPSLTTPISLISIARQPNASGSNGPSPV